MGTPPELAVEFGPAAAPKVDVRVAAGTVAITVAVLGPAAPSVVANVVAGTVA